MGARKKAKIDVEPQNESGFEVTDIEMDSNNEIDMDENLLDESDDNEIPFADEVYVPQSTVEAVAKEKQAKRRGVQPGTIRENVEIDYSLQFNLDILQMLNKFDPNSKAPTTDQLAEIPGLGDNYIRRLRLRGLNLQSDLYKCLVIAEELNVNLVGELQPGQKFCDNALFIKVPKK